MGHVLDMIANYGHYALDAVAAATGNPEFIPLIEGTNSAAHTYASGGHNLGKSLQSGAISAGTSYAGGQIGNALGGPSGILGNAGNIGQATNAITGGGSIGNFIGNEFGDIAPALANTSVASVLGGAAGQALGTSLQGPSKSTDTGPAPGFTPSQSSASPLPPSLSGLSTLDPTQQASNLATQGTFGGGNGPQEQDYYKNLLNRQLVDSSGKVADINTLSPIESSYNQQLGLGGYNNSTDLLKALSQWKQAA